MSSATGDPPARVAAALTELGRREVTSVLLEGGPTLAGAFLDAGEVDELRLFIAPIVIGGAGAKPLFGGTGASTIADAIPALELEWERSGGTCWFEPAFGSGEGLMFTGLVREVGTVESFDRTDAGARLRVGARLAPSSQRATRCRSRASASPSTSSGDGLVRGRRDEPDALADHSRRGSSRASRSISSRRCGRASRSGGTSSRGTSTPSGAVAAITDDGFSRRVRVAAPVELHRYLAEHGSVALDGVSLTIAGLTEEGFEVGVDPGDDRADHARRALRG